jgi:large subunit ribosomal protein L24
MLKIKKGDTVEVIRGDDKGKKGRVISVLPGAKRALVEGINMVKKHKRKTQNEPQGGIVSIETPVSMANILPFCKRCNAAARIGFKQMADTKSRICKSCKEEI